MSGAPGGTVTLNYTGAATGASNFIRVKLVNDAAPGLIAYMAVPVSNITAAGGSFSLALPAGMSMGTYTAYAWAEEGNGANLTNQGSKPDKFRLTVGTPKPPSPLPKTGDGFPLYALLALLGAALGGMGWLGTRLRKQRKRA